MLWALEGLRMLHWGTHRWAGRLAGSRLASSYDAMLLMMLSLSSAGPHLSGELAGFFLSSSCPNTVVATPSVLYARIRHFFSHFNHLKHEQLFS